MSEKWKPIEPIEHGNHAPSGGDCEADEWLERGNHPLLNDVILDTLFGFVRHYDLKSSRVVCNKWNRHTIPHMRSHFEVTICGSQSNDITGQDPRCIDHFVKLFSSNKWGIPFTKFRLSPFQTTDGVGQQFLRLCGESASEIDLNCFGSQDLPDYIIEDVSEVLRSSPNIQVLAFGNRIYSRSGNIVKLFPDFMPTFSCLKKIKFRPDYQNSRLKFCPTYIEELLTAAPNISDIHALDIYTEEVNRGRNIGVVLNCIEKLLGRKSTVQSLFLEDATIAYFEVLQKLGQNGLKLKSLNFDFRFGSDEVQIKLANCFKDTLEHLNVVGWTDNILRDLQNMPALKSLTHQIKFDLDSKAVNLNEKFPALEILDIGLEDMSPEEWDEFFSEFPPCPTIKSLIILENYMKIPMFYHFLIIFPNLTKLTFKVKDDTVEILRLLWSRTTELESLTISVSIEQLENLNLDSLFTGIPTRALKIFASVLRILKEMTVEEKRETILNFVREHSRLPSIRNLTKLKYLDLQLDGKIHMSDLTAYLAFFPMIHLKHLEIDKCHITKSCCEIMTKETGLETWSFQNRVFENIILPFLLPGRKFNFY